MAGFADEYELKPFPNKVLYDLADEYERRCEEYDQCVCSHRTPQGIAMPGDWFEMRMIESHAIEVLQSIAYKAGAAGYCWKDVDAILKGRK